MIYLDNAATTFPKPREVTRAVWECLTRYCGNPGRGAHPLALRTAEEIYTCRERLSALFCLGAPERILFTAGATASLNLLVHGYFQNGAHVLISELEHNAVLRPLAHRRARGELSFDVFPVVGLDTTEILSGIRARLRPNTAAVLCTHASNVCSVTLPLAEIGTLCRAQKIRLFVDAAQSAGHLPIDMRAMHVDALAAPGHKSLYGIQGVGVLALGEGVELTPLLQGGAGMESESLEMPALPPERYEAGTLPSPAIVALSAGVKFLQERGIEQMHATRCTLFDRAAERIATLPNATLYAPSARGSTLLFSLAGIPSTAVATHLARQGICTRAGLHCAPLAHRALGTPEDGAVRLSFGAFNTTADLDALWSALREGSF